MSLPSDERNRNQTVTKMPHFGPAVKVDPSKADPLARLIQSRLGDYQRIKPFILEHPARFLGVRPARSQTRPDTQPHNNERLEHHSHRYQNFMKPKNGKHSQRSSGKRHGKSIKPENLTDKHLSNGVASTTNSSASQSTVMLANSSTSQSTSTLLPVDYSMPSRIRAQSSILSRTTSDEVNEFSAGTTNTPQIHNKLETYGKKNLALNASEKLVSTERVFSSTATSSFTMQPSTTVPHPYSKQECENQTEIKENYNLYQHRDVTKATQRKYLSEECSAFSGQDTTPKKRINKHRCQGIFPVNSPTTFTASSLPSLTSSDSSSMTATDHSVTP